MIEYEYKECQVCMLIYAEEVGSDDTIRMKGGQAAHAQNRYIKDSGSFRERCRSLANEALFEYKREASGRLIMQWAAESQFRWHPSGDRRGGQVLRKRHQVIVEYTKAEGQNNRFCDRH